MRAKCQLSVLERSLGFVFADQLSFFAQVNNLFNRSYTTAAQLGATGFTANGNFIARSFSSIGDNSTLVGSTFYAPGAPRTIWAGIRYAVGK